MSVCERVSSVACHRKSKKKYANWRVYSICYFSSPLQYIDTARDLLDTELTAMVGESYQRAYNSMVAVQMLAELEEVIQYKLVPERRQPITQIWWERLQVGERKWEKE